MLYRFKCHKCNKLILVEMSFLKRLKELIFGGAIKVCENCYHKFYSKKEEKRKKRIKQKEVHKKSKFKVLLDNLETNREAIIEKNKELKPQFEDENSDEIKCKFMKMTFLFDREGFKFFRDIFNNYGRLAVINRYLAIDEEANEWIPYFHRSFMQNDIEGFCMENNCEHNEVEVHHIDFSTTNNKKKNLQVMFIADHKKLHIREKFNGTDKQFEVWYDKNVV
ncbi:hypothetical protein KAR52_01735 [Candidatus Pacearchaeota archaeon]|nr:hypothetical protein [Candidatus Pacearchaeota archaeon]